jgi:hypothetical protein
MAEISIHFPLLDYLRREALSPPPNHYAVARVQVPMRWIF